MHTDDRFIAENDPRRGPRKPGVKQTRNHRQSQQSQKRLNGHQNIRHYAHRPNPAVINSTHILKTQKNTMPEAFCSCGMPIT